MDRNDLLNTTREQLLDAYSVALEKSMAEAAVTIAARSDDGDDRKTSIDAQSVLRNQSAHLRQEIVQHMGQLLERSFKTTYSAYRPSVATSLTADSLSLVESSALEDELRVNEITKRFGNAADDELRDLNCRIAVMFEQEDIRERENPFRPYLFTRSLILALESLGRASEVTSLLTRQLADSLSPRMAEVYARLNEHLSGHGISAQLALKIQAGSGYSVPTSSGSGSGGSGSGVVGGGGYGGGTAGRHGGGATGASVNYGYSGAVSPAAAPQQRVASLLDAVRGKASGFSQFEGAPMLPGYEVPAATGNAKGWLRSEDEAGDVLRKFFNNAKVGPVADRPALDARAVLTRATGTVSQPGFVPMPPGATSGISYVSAGGGAFPSIGEPSQAVAPASMEHVVPAAGGELRNLVMEHRERLAESATDTEQQMVIDIVAMLFEFILRDPLVPQAVRAQLGRLQFLLLKMASRDPALLTQTDHPARMLVNRIGSLALNWKHDDARSAKVAAEVARLVDRLLEDDGETAELFATLTSELDAFVAREIDSAQARENLDLAIEAVESARQRLRNLARTSAQMRTALTGLAIDPYLGDFLRDSWVRAIERTERTDAKRAQRFRELVPDLLWSIVPKANESDWAQLIAMLPVIVSTLREGIILVGWNPSQQQTLMNWLVEVHTGVLRGGRQGGVSPSLDSFRNHFTALTDGAESAAPDIRTHEQHEDYVRDAVREFHAPLRLLDPLLTASSGEPTAKMRDGETEIGVGSVLELPIDDGPHVARVAWLSEDETQLIITTDDVPEPSLLGRRTLDNLLGVGRASVLEAQPLFTRAVHALLTSASRMDEVRRPG